MPLGIGALDAEGIWQYGESDEESLASDLLNYLADSVSTQLGLDRGRLGVLEGRIPIVTNLAAIDALSTSIVGALAYMTAPGTGINALFWEAYGGTGSGLDWRPLGPITADTKANLDSFISAVAAIADTRFQVGALATVTGTGEQYRFTSTAGALAPVPGSRIIPSAATNGSVSAAGVVTSTAQSLVRVRDAFPAGFTVFRVTFDVTMSGASGPLLQLAVDATDAATAYDRQSHAAVSAASVPAQGLNGSSGGLSPVNVAGARHFGSFLITDANVAGPTYVDSHTVIAAPAAMTTSTGRSESGIMHRTSTAYNSFTLFGSAGNVTVNRLTIEGVS